MEKYEKPVYEPWELDPYLPRPRDPAFDAYPEYKTAPVGSLRGKPEPPTTRRGWLTAAGEAWARDNLKVVLSANQN